MALEGIQGNTLGARAVLISTSGIFPVYLLKPCVNLYVLLGQIMISNTTSNRVNKNIATRCTHNQ